MSPSRCTSPHHHLYRTTRCGLRPRLHQRRTAEGERRAVTIPSGGSRFRRYRYTELVMDSRRNLLPCLSPYSFLFSIVPREGMELVSLSSLSSRIINESCDYMEGSQSKRFTAPQPISTLTSSTPELMSRRRVDRTLWQV